MALPQHLQHYRGLIDIISATVVSQIEAERAAEAECEAPNSTLAHVGSRFTTEAGKSHHLSAAS